MLKAVKVDLEDVCDALEHLSASLGRLTREEKIDVAARLRSAAKTVESIDKSIKEDIAVWRKGKPGYVNGEIFKAKYSVNPVNRLDQKALKEEEHEIHAKFTKANNEVRISFEPR